MKSKGDATKVSEREIPNAHDLPYWKGFRGTRKKENKRG